MAAESQIVAPDGTTVAQVLLFDYRFYLVDNQALRMIDEIEAYCWDCSRFVASERIRTPEDVANEFMNEIQFEIVSTDDGGADIGLMEIHPEVKNVALSPLVYDCCSKYLSLVKRYAPGWRRSLITLRESEGDWKLTVDFEYE